MLRAVHGPLTALLIGGCIFVAQVEDDYYVAHHHGGALLIRFGLIIGAFLLGIAGAVVFSIGSTAAPR